MIGGHKALPGGLGHRTTGIQRSAAKKTKCKDRGARKVGVVGTKTEVVVGGGAMGTHWATRQSLAGTYGSSMLQHAAACRSTGF